MNHSVLTENTLIQIKHDNSSSTLIQISLYYIDHKSHKTS